METDLAQLVVHLAKLSDQISALVYWMKILTGAVAASLFVSVAVFARVVRVDRWQMNHGAPLERLAAEQRAQAARSRLIAARRPHHSGTNEVPH